MTETPNSNDRLWTVFAHAVTLAWIVLAIWLRTPTANVAASATASVPPAVERVER